MRIERRHVERAIGGLDGVQVIQTGIGKHAILRTLDMLAAKEPLASARGACNGWPSTPGSAERPRLAPLAHARGSLFILAGLCGGLTAGHEVPPIARVIDEHGHEWTPTLAPRFDDSALGTRHSALGSPVTLIGVDRIISTPADKRALAAATGAAIVDMESHAFAARCEELGVPWAVVRGVSDTPEETLPEEVLHWITPEGNTRTARAVRDMLLHPGHIPHILAFVRRSNRVLPQVGERVVRLIAQWQAQPTGASLLAQVAP